MSPSPVPVFIKPVRQIVGVSTAGSSGSAQFQGGTLVDTVQTQTTTIIADAVIEERHEDQMVITEQPVEQGATISDHAYKLPSRLELTYAWSEASPQNTTQDYAFLKNIYQQLLGLQTTRTLCQVFTGKRLYQNMLIQSLLETTEKETENSLVIRVSMQEILIATTQQVNLTSAAVQQLPQQTAPIVNQGSLTLQNAPNFNPNAP